MDTETRQAIESLIAIIENSAPLAMGYRERALERAKALLRTQIPPTIDKPRDEALSGSQGQCTCQGWWVGKDQWFRSKANPLCPIHGDPRDTSHGHNG